MAILRAILHLCQRRAEDRPNSVSHSSRIESSDDIANMSSPQQIKTTLTDFFGIKHPVLLAGMGSTSGARLAAAVTNAGGMGIIGGNGYTPQMLREEIAELKSYLHDKNAPFGVDLLIPQVGGTARKTNYDYNKGKLMELIDVMVETKTKLFVCAIGIPPVEAVEKLHKNGILVITFDRPS